MNVNFEEIEVLTQTRVADNWTRTMVVYDNTSRPTDEDTPFIAFTVLPTDAENRTLGKDRKKTTKNGFLNCDVFVPINRGSREAMQIADEFIALMENIELGNTLFTYAGTANRVGDAANALQAGGNAWHQVNVLIDFQAT